MKQLSEAATNILRTAENSAAKQNTPPPGSIIEAGKPTTRLAQYRRDRMIEPAVVAELAGQLRSNSLWAIGLDANAIDRRMNLLREALTPATFEEAAYWLARFLHHFPTKNAERDAVIISDVAAYVVERQYGIGALVSALDELRNAATLERPFMPPSGAIIARIADKCEKYLAIARADARKLQEMGAL